MPQGRDFDIFIPYISKGSRELNIEKYKPKSAFTKSMKKYFEENCSTMAKGGELLDADTDVEYAKGGRQGYDDKLDESLGNRRGKRSKKRQDYKDRRDESKGMERARYRRAYSSVGTMDKRERYI